MKLYTTEQNFKEPYNLSWQQPNASPWVDPLGVVIRTVNPQRDALYQGMHLYSDLWKVEYTQGLQLTVFDPVPTRHTGKYVCRAIPKHSDTVESGMDTLSTEIRINVNGKKYFI